MITFDLLFSFFMFKYRQESMWGDGILKKEYLVPRYITAGEIKETRKALKLSQEEFAELLGCSKPTVVRWENGKEKRVSRNVRHLRYASGQKGNRRG